LSNSLSLTQLVVDLNTHQPVKVGGISGTHPLFLVDGRAGLTAADENLAQSLRQFNTPIHLVINKIDGLKKELVSAEFHCFGFEIHAISAAHQQGINVLMETVLSTLPKSPLVGDLQSEAEEMKK